MVNEIDKFKKTSKKIKRANDLEDLNKDDVNYLSAGENKFVKQLYMFEWIRNLIIILQANLNFNKKNCQVLVKFIDKFHIKIAGELAHLLINDSSISEGKLANLFEGICKVC